MTELNVQIERTYKIRVKTEPDLQLQDVAGRGSSEGFPWALMFALIPTLIASTLTSIL